MSGKEVSIGGSSTSAVSSGALDLRRRIQIVECYGVAFRDRDSPQKQGAAHMEEGQLTYYKTDRRVILFGPKNVKKVELFNCIINEPNVDPAILNDKKDWQAKRPTLPVDHVFVLDQRYEIRIEKVKFVHHKPYKAASSERETTALHHSVRKYLEKAPDVLAGVLPPAGTQQLKPPQHRPQTRTLPASQRNRSASPPPRSRPGVHSHIGDKTV